MHQEEIGNSRATVMFQKQNISNTPLLTNSRSCVVLEILNMDERKLHFQHVMLFLHKKGGNAAQTCKNICGAFGENVIDESMVWKWFAKFKARDFSLDDVNRSGRHSAVNDDCLKAQIESIFDMTHKIHIDLTLHLLAILYSHSHSCKQ